MVEMEVCKLALHKYIYLLTFIFPRLTLTHTQSDIALILFTAVSYLGSSLGGLGLSKGKLKI